MAMGLDFSMPSMLGFVALAGVVVNNSILLVDFIRNADCENCPLREVLLSAGAVRFKPILLTAIAAMIGKCGCGDTPSGGAPRALASEVTDALMLKEDRFDRDADAQRDGAGD